MLGVQLAQRSLTHWQVEPPQLPLLHRNGLKAARGQQVPPTVLPQGWQAPLELQKPPPLSQGWFSRDVSGTHLLFLQTVHRVARLVAQSSSLTQSTQVGRPSMIVQSMPQVCG